MKANMRGTTILAVRKGKDVAVGGDGQVSLGDTALKHTARKIRRLADDSVIVGFAGSTADSMTLVERFEGKLKEFKGNLARAAIELAKQWRTDRLLRRLEAFLVVADSESVLLISGSGDVMEPDDGVIGIGSGGAYAAAAAKALVRHTDMTPEAVVREAIGIAAGICVYTNEQIVVETLP